jgi:hypothetical protein
MMRLIGVAIGTLIAAIGVAHAQNAPWCLQYEEAQHCTYETLQQCLANRTGLGGFCNQNSTYTPIPSTARASRWRS